MTLKTALTDTNNYPGSTSAERANRPVSAVPEQHSCTLLQFKSVAHFKNPVADPVGCAPPSYLSLVPNWVCYFATHQTLVWWHSPLAYLLVYAAPSGSVLPSHWRRWLLVNGHCPPGNCYEVGLRERNTERHLQCLYMMRLKDLTQPPQTDRRPLHPDIHSGDRTLHQRVKWIHWWQVGCYGNILIPPRCLDVHGNGPRWHVVVETGDHPSRKGHVRQTALAVVTGGREGGQKVVLSQISREQFKNKTTGIKMGSFRKQI